MNRRYRMRPRAASRIQPWLLVGVWCVTSLGVAQQPSANVVRLPAPWLLPNGQLSPSTASRSGLELEVDTRWSDSYGYRPMRFTFKGARPATSDSQITVRFYADDYADTEYSLLVEQDGELRAGNRSVSLIVRAPQLDSWNFIRWDVWIDGIMEPQLSLGPEQAMSVNRWQQGGLTLFDPVVGSGGSSSVSTYPPTGIGVAGIQANRVSGPLPADWLDYSCFDYVVMSIEELTTANRVQPERIAMLRRWINAGGNLWVERTGVQPPRLEEVSKLLQLDPPPAREVSKDTERDDLAAGWSYVTFAMPVSVNEDRPDRRTTSFPPLTELPEIPEALPQAVIPEYLQRLAESPQDSRGWFVEHPTGFGTVTAFASDWQAIPHRLSRGAQGVAAMRWYQRSWLPRHGLAPNAPNSEFSNLLIPGVGLAPVTEFRVLITIFVLLIGPLNYWVLSRAKRLYLLVLTVPLGAAAVTLLLFSYAFLADGLATQLRARSFTMLDQPTGEAVSWSRLSYYAGFAPASGLSFPGDTAVYPILPEIPGLNPRSRRAGRVVLWQDDYQDLTQGWLPSRTPTQFLAVRAHPSPAKLEVRAARDRCQVTNRLGAPVAWLAVIDENEQIWHGTDIGLEQRIELRPVATKDAMRQLRESLLANKPEMPPELQIATDSQRQSTRRGRGRYGRYRFRGEGGEFRLNSNLLEKRLEGLTEASGGATSNGFRPRSYLALTNFAVDTPLGLDSAEEAASFHVVEGRW
ncbi:MAG: hypothetical protein WD851_07965 [Pirellulales bacterium]